LSEPSPSPQLHSEDDSAPYGSFQLLLDRLANFVAIHLDDQVAALIEALCQAKPMPPARCVEQLYHAALSGLFSARQRGRDVAVWLGLLLCKVPLWLQRLHRREPLPREVRRPARLRRSF
jgi:hypothetical protein